MATVATAARHSCNFYVDVLSYDDDDDDDGSSSAMVSQFLWQSAWNGFHFYFIAVDSIFTRAYRK